MPAKGTPPSPDEIVIRKWAMMTDEEYAAFCAATYRLKPLVPLGTWAGLDGLVVGFVTILAMSATSYFGGPDTISAGVGLVAANFAGLSLSKEKWRLYHSRCEAEIKAIHAARE